MKKSEPADCGKGNGQSGDNENKGRQLFFPDQGGLNQKEKIRLNHYLSDAGFCSRREADRLIAAGRVWVDGEIAQIGKQVRSEQEICVDGHKILREQEMILLLVNKPAGVVCTTDTRWNDRTIYEVVNYPKRVFSAGRLDKNSEGLLLLTNNGELLDQMMRARNCHEKEYLVTVDRNITEQFLEKMSAGIYLKDLKTTTRPCRVIKEGPKRFRIILTQGLNRQIRRMCAACQYQVVRLERIRIMNLLLGDLKPGEYRMATNEEYQTLLRLLRRE